MSLKGGYQIINLSGVKIVNPGQDNKVISPISLEELKRMHYNKKIPVISGFIYDNTIISDMVGYYDDFDSFETNGNIATEFYDFNFIKENNITYVYFNEK